MPLIPEEFARVLLILHNCVNFLSFFLWLIVILMALKMVIMCFPAVETKPAKLVSTFDASHVVAPHVLFNRVLTAFVRTSFGVLPNPEKISSSFWFFLFPVLCLLATARGVGIPGTFSAENKSTRACFCSSFSFRLKLKVKLALRVLAFNYKRISHEIIFP